MNRLLAAAVTMLWAGCASRAHYGYSGTLQAPSAAVGSTIGGRVAAVFVREGDSVHRGEVMLQFVDSNERAALAGALGRLAQARAALADLKAGARPEDLARTAALARQQLAEYHAAASTQPYQSTIARNQLHQALAQLSDAQAAAADAHVDAERMRKLFATGDVSAQERDAAVEREARAHAQLVDRIAAVRAARAQRVNTTRVTLPQNALAALAAYHAAEEQHRLLAAGPRPDAVRQAEAAVRSAHADVAAAQARLDDMIVRSPSDGMVTAMDLHAGDLIAPGASIATIDESGNPYARIYVPQKKLGEVRVSAHVQVRSDSLPTARFDGVVEEIDDRAQFTPQDVQTAADREILSFGVKVRVLDPRHQLFPGTTVEVDVP
jgi:HlyD family secretion protein